MLKLALILAIIANSQIQASEFELVTNYDDIIQVNNIEKKDLDLLVCAQHREDFNPNGKHAVLNVIINRVNSKKFPNTIEKVLKQSGQFPWVKKVGLKCNIENNIFYQEKYNAILWAIEQSEFIDITNNSLYFHKKSTLGRIKIGSHYFSHKF